MNVYISSVEDGHVGGAVVFCAIGSGSTRMMLACVALCIDVYGDGVVVQGWNEGEPHKVPQDGREVGGSV